MISITSNSENETVTLGRKVASILKKGDVVNLTGDLGAGKTKFVSGLLDFYNKQDEISSPTFTIVNEHTLSSDLKLFHFDVYRLENPDEFLAIGGDEFFTQGICLIEWGEKIEHLLPQNHLRIQIEKDIEDESKRKFTFTSSNQNLIKAIEEAIL